MCKKCILGMLFAVLVSAVSLQGMVPQDAMANPAMIADLQRDEDRANVQRDIRNYQALIRYLQVETQDYLQNIEPLELDDARRPLVQDLLDTIRVQVQNLQRVIGELIDQLNNL